MNESFNGKVRDECLNLEWFRSRVEAQVGGQRATLRTILTMKFGVVG